MSKKQNKKFITPEILRGAVKGAFVKLNPRYMMRNPVMFVVEIGCFITQEVTGSSPVVSTKKFLISCEIRNFSFVFLKFVYWSSYWSSLTNTMTNTAI